MFKEPIPCHLTVMVMAENENNEILTIDRIKSWNGITFPGGHLEPDESVLDCARREVLEETGIRIKGLSLNGLIHWVNQDNGERYLVYCIRAKACGGSLKDSEEGPAAWLTLEELALAKTSPGFLDQVRLFTDPHLSEAFGTYGSGGDSQLRYDNGGRT